MPKAPWMSPTWAASSTAESEGAGISVAGRVGAGACGIGVMGTCFLPAVAGDREAGAPGHAGPGLDQRGRDVGARHWRRG
ncbi:hypothetical protein SAT01_39630 [Sinomonas atrocyanea]|nr:hypothetical protein SAT01_39630 [Sinomonas atrocyanea]GGG71831.1 hypothetical protein GCM10007172_25210 [Sinomonas atrocyanea]